MAHYSKTMRKILVIDDEEPIRKYLESLLSEQGYAIASAASGNQALFLVEQEHFDLAVLDLIFEGEDGMELLSALKASNPKMPVVILTGIGYEEDVLQEAHRRGADGYVGKLVAVEQLLTEIHRVLRHAPEQT